VYFKEQEDAYSASSISSAVQSYGGAGYVIEYGGKYYITVACYYSDKDAQSVCFNLLGRGLKCGVININVSGKKLTTSFAKNNKQKYEGNLNTLHSLSRICYEAANKLDEGEYSQSQAKGALEGVMDSLNGLLRSNEGNPFTSELNYLIAECEDVYYGFVLSRELRRLQIAITDCIVNINLNL
jgi:hypothetical protein